jgi:flagellar hook-length control protein FliK
VQVSVLVKDGVQHAELHLNPAETGPVSIAITLEGTQAHVAFGADLAATRQAIENGLPALASALRDAGFTLAGGGVAQHSRSGAGRDDQGSSRDDRGRSRPSAAIDSIAAPAQRSSHRVAEGGIDLYA